MTLTVRPAHPAELAAIGDLTVAAYVADGYLAPDDRYAEHLRDAVTRAAQAELYVAELADAPGAVAGTVTFCPEGSPWRELAGPGDGEFRMLAVDPAFRGRGLAAALVSTCVERSRELGYTAVVMCSMTVQTPAHRIYERLGFRREPGLDWSPEAGVELLGFRLPL